MSGYRILWGTYYLITHYIFVIASSDKTCILVAREEVQQLLSHPDISSRNISILFFDNKMNIRDALILDSIINKSWDIYSSNTLKGDGIEWLSSAIKTALESK